MLNKSSQFWARLVVICIALFFISDVVSLTTPLILSLVLAFILSPVVDGIVYLAKKYLKISNFPRWIAIFPTFILFGLILVLGFKLAFIPLVTQVIKLVNNVPYIIGDFMQVIQTIQNQYSYNVPKQVVNIINNILLRFSNYGILLAQKGIGVVFSLASFLAELLLVPILTFYMLKDGKKLTQNFVNLFEGNTKIRIESVLNKIYFTVSGYIRAELFLAVDMFIIVYIAMTYFDIPYPLVLALIAAIAEWIPIIGPILGATPAIILASLISLPLAINVALFYVLIQIIDGQIIMPKVFGKFIKLHPIVIITVIFIGGSLYGVKGMMLAVPVTAILQILAEDLWYFDRVLKGDEKDETSK